MDGNFRLLRLGVASQLTQSGGGWILLEPNMIDKYDPI
jgi:hypothetical protein